jgi:Flp pilus assembly protein TadD
MLGQRTVLLALCLGLAACGMIKPRPEAPGQADGPSAAVPDKGDPATRFAAALALQKQNQVAEAEEALKSLTTDFPDHSGPWTNLGIIYARSNRRDLAINALLKAATLNDSNKIAFNWLGILYRETGDLNRSRLSYEKALKIDPNYALAHYNLGVLLDAHMKQPLSALEHYKAYQQAGHADDLRVMAWVAEIEAAEAAKAPAPAAPAPGTAPRIEQTP